MTEMSGMVSMTPVHWVNSHTVGYPLPLTEVKVSAAFLLCTRDARRLHQLARDLVVSSMSELELNPFLFLLSNLSLAFSGGRVGGGLYDV